MSKPIYKFFMARFTEAWHQLSEEEQKSLAAKVDATLVSPIDSKCTTCDRIKVYHLGRVVF